MPSLRFRLVLSKREPGSPALPPLCASDEVSPCYCTACAGALAVVLTEVLTWAQRAHRVQRNAT